MPWWTIFRSADGELLGCTSVLPDEIPPGTETREYVDRPDQGTRWDPALREFVALPPPVLIDRLQDLADHPYAAELWQRLTSPQRTKLRRLLAWLLGGQRFRAEAEEVPVDAPDGWPTDPDQVNP